MICKGFAQLQFPEESTQSSDPLSVGLFFLNVLNSVSNFWKKHWDHHRATHGLQTQVVCGEKRPGKRALHPIHIWPECGKRSQIHLLFSPSIDWEKFLFQDFHTMLACKF